MNSVTFAQQAAALLITDCFQLTPGRMHSWLIFDATRSTKPGVLLVIGALRPRKKKLKRLRHLLGIVEVDPRFDLLLARHGPSALRFDGKTLVANGN